MSIIVIIGASQGIGYEFVRQYTANPNDTIIATFRDDEAKQKLLALGSNIQVYPLDVRDLDAIKGLAHKLEGTPIDTLIVNAGIYGDNIELSQDSIDMWVDVFKVNTVAPVMIALSLTKNLLEGAQKKLIAITSQMGSIDDNSSGGHIPYRTSKAALNMAWKSLSLDFAKHGIIATVLHPGWVQTRMGGEAAPIDVETSVASMRAVIDDLRPAHSGAFLRYNGSTIAW
jgi:NAD(P)-dependent dehydrogenase (short-subunit alcohol dehydrogenase family)